MSKYYLFSFLSLFLFIGIACNSKTETAEDTAHAKENVTVDAEESVDEQSEQAVSQPPFSRFLSMAGDEEPAKPVVIEAVKPEPKTVVEQAPELKPVIVQAPEPKPVVVQAPEPKPEPVVIKVPESEPIIVAKIQSAKTEAEDFVNFFTKPEIVAPTPKERPVIVAQNPKPVVSKPVEIPKKAESPKTLPNNVETVTNDSRWIPFIYYYRPPQIWYQPSMYTVVFQTPLPHPVQIQPTQPLPVVMPMVPVYQVQSVYVPQIVPNRFGVSRFVYPNGVVIKQKMYVTP